MIKGFIEVTSANNGKKFLVNIKWIECIKDSTIHFAFNAPNAVDQDYIKCKETCEEIKQKIKEAVG